MPKRLIRRVLGALLGNVDDPGVEVAVLAGQALVDHVGDNVGDPAPIARRREVGQAGHLVLGEHIPQAEFDPQPTVGLKLGRAVYKGLGVDQTPVGEARRGLQAEQVLDEGALVDRPEQARALQIRGNHPGNLAPQVGVARRLAVEVRDRDWQRRHQAVDHVDIELGSRPVGWHQDEPKKHQRKADEDHEMQKGFSFHNDPFRCSAVILTVGSKRQTGMP